MQEERLSIGKMAQMNHLSVSTLRLYDEKGLLKPRYVDPETGYRYYELNQNARLDLIIYMKELGMSLAEIKQSLEQENITLIEEILSRKNEQLHQQMKDLKARHDAVERAIQSIERCRKSPRTGTLSLEYIDRRYAFGIPCSLNFYDTDVHGYEKVLIELRETLEQSGFQQIHSYNIGTSITKADFCAERFCAAEIFIFTNRCEYADPRLFRVVDSGMYACIYLDHFDDEINGAKALKKHCEENGYEINGDYICEVMTGFHVFDKDPGRMFLRLQIPVSFPALYIR